MIVLAPLVVVVITSAVVVGGSIGCCDHDHGRY